VPVGSSHAAVVGVSLRFGWGAVLVVGDEICDGNKVVAFTELAGAPERDSGRLLSWGRCAASLLLRCGGSRGAEGQGRRVWWAMVDLGELGLGSGQADA
jgi:hypothetical protein